VIADRKLKIMKSIIARKNEKDANKPEMWSNKLNGWTTDIRQAARYDRADVPAVRDDFKERGEKSVYWFDID
jgi:hypothetical protein